VFVPIQKGINNIGSWLYNRTEGFKDLQTVVKENEALQEKINELTAQNSTLQLEHYEYLRLLELLNLNEKYSDYNKVAARITGKEPGNWFNTFTIDKGTNDGLKVDMNVIAGSGLVGIISDVGPNWAKVRSIIDDSSNVSAMDLNTTDLCIVAGDLKSMTSSQTILFQDMSDSDGNSAVGDQVVTSNISSKFLPGLLIGYISSIKKDGNNLTVSGEITPVVDFEHLEEVLVITKLKE
jgi:rod shape-determining protein MreC